MRDFFIYILIIIIFLLVSRPNRNLTENFSPLTNQIEIGTIDIGRHPGNQMNTTFNFKNVFGRIPFVFLEVLYEKDYNWNDVIQPTITRIYNNKCDVNLKRVDRNDIGWGQDLKLMYISIGLENESP